MVKELNQNEILAVSGGTVSKCEILGFIGVIGVSLVSVITVTGAFGIGELLKRNSFLGKGALGVISVILIELLFIGVAIKLSDYTIEKVWDMLPDICIGE